MYAPTLLDQYQPKNKPVISKQEIFPIISTSWNPKTRDYVAEILKIKGMFDLQRATKKLKADERSVSGAIKTLVARGKLRVVMVRVKTRSVSGVRLKATYEVMQ